MKPSIDLFNQVDQHGKANLIHGYGEFIVTREYYGNKVNLYALPGFYAEIIYNPEANQISDIRAITTESKDIEKYLPYIVI